MSQTTHPRLVLGVVAALICAAVPAVHAQRSANQPSVAVELAALPEPQSRRLSLDVGGRTLPFEMTAGALALTGKEGVTLAEVGYTAYVLERESADRSRRPLVFAFNGGPGSASTWLHLGAMGPWRLPLEGRQPGEGGALLPNAETWLDFADLVFLDPPGTGQARVWPSASDEQRQASRESGGRRWFWSLGGDIATFVEAIATLTRRMERTASPIVLVGESYGGFRVPHIAEGLTREKGLGVTAMVLVSPVVDFDGRRGGHLPMHSVGLLPSLAATRLERAGAEPTRAALADVEAYARGDYLTDLVRGPRNEAAVGRMAVAVAGHAGMLPEQVRGLQGRVTAGSFMRDAGLAARGPVSLYDAGMTGLSAPPPQGRGFNDPFTSGLSPLLSEAMVRLLADKTGWRVSRPYLTLASEVTRGWIWGRSPHPPEALTALGRLISVERRRTALVVHGYTDLITPYFATALALDLLAPHQPDGRIAFEVYPGGHMFYSRDASRIRFRDHGERAIRSATEPTRPAVQPSMQRETP